MNNEIEKRKIKRDGFCRGCDKELIRDKDEVIYTYSFRNRGQSIIFCMDCAKKIGELANQK